MDHRHQAVNGRWPLRPRVRARRLRRRRSSRAWTASPSTRSWPRPCSPSSTSTTAARPAPTPTRATAPGILLQVPDAFLRAARRLRAAAGRRSYGVAVCFLPTDDDARARARGAARAGRRGRGPARARLARRAGRRRDALRHDRARGRCPSSASSFVGARATLAGDQDAFERKLYVIRRVVEQRGRPDLVVPSLLARARSSTRACSPRCSSRRFYPDLRDERDGQPRWRSSTRASRPTRSRAGSSRTRTG